MDRQQANQEQQIINDCSPTFCACDPNSDRCLQGYENNRAGNWADQMADFHLYRTQQRIDASMQPAHREEPTSSIRRRLMASRLTAQQNPASMWGRFCRTRQRIAAENAMLASRQPGNIATRPFGILVPEQAAAGPLQHLAAPQGRDHMAKEEELQCQHEVGYCISGDSNSSDSLEKSRKRQQ